MGDVIHALPAVASLKHSFPHSRVSWVIRPRWIPLVEGNDQAVMLAHEIAVADWLRSEIALTTGTQYILLLHEPWPGALAALQRTWARTCRGLSTVSRTAAGDTARIPC